MLKPVAADRKLTHVIFHAATGLDESAIATVQANVRKRILRAFVACGHIEA